MDINDKLIAIELKKQIQERFNVLDFRVLVQGLGEIVPMNQIWIFISY